MQDFFRLCTYMSLQIAEAYLVFVAVFSYINLNLLMYKRGKI